MALLIDRRHIEEGHRGRESYRDRTGSGIELQTSNMKGLAKVLCPTELNL